MSESSTVSGNSALRVIESITQFIGGTQAVWDSITIPIPSGLLVYATDTTVIKLGDGVTLYANLSILFTLSTLTTFQSEIAALQAVVNGTSDGNAALLAEVAALQAIVDSATEGNVALLADFNTLNANVSTLNTASSAQLADITALQAIVDGASEGNATLLAAIQALQAIVNSGTEGNAELFAALGTLASEYSTQQTALSALQAIVDSASEGNAALLADVTALQAIVNSGTEGNAALLADINALRTTVDGITFEQMPYYWAQQSGSVTVLTSGTDYDITYDISAVTITFPAYSKTGAFRIFARMVSSGVANDTMAGSLLNQISDGTNLLGLTGWLVTATAGEGWQTGDTFITNWTYEPGSTWTITQQIVAEGSEVSTSLHGSYMNLFVMEA